MAVEEEEENEKPKGKGKLITKILLFGVLPVMTAVLLVIGTLFIAGVFPGGGDTQTASVEEGVEGESEGGDEEQEGDEAGAESENSPAIYIPVDPAFVVNFASQGKARFLQITVEVMTRSEAVPEQVKLHMPVIRNNLNLLFSDQSYDSISTLEGKETLREETLEAVQQILEEETGDPGIEAVYFTSIVMQ